MYIEQSRSLHEYAKKIDLLVNDLLAFPFDWFTFGESIWNERINENVATKVPLYLSLSDSLSFNESMIQ